MSSSKKRFNILENIENHISMLKPEPDVAEKVEADTVLAKPEPDVAEKVEADTVLAKPEPDVAEKVEADAAPLKWKFDVLKSIEEHIALLKPEFPPQAMISIGEYLAKILLESHLIDKINNVTPLFVSKSSGEIVKWSQYAIGDNLTLGLDSRVDTHYWYNVQAFTSKNDAFIARLREKAVRKQDDAIVVSSLWDGIGSGLLPLLISTLAESNIISVAMGILPSRLQSPDVHFNAFSSTGLCVSQNLSPLLLVDRDCLEAFVGANRDGSIMKGEVLISYILELMLTKDSFVPELSEYSRSFNVQMFSILPATGASLNIYGSLENMLDSALHQPLLKFDLSSSSVLYVLIRMPQQLKDKFTRGRIELSVADWIKKKANLRSVYVSEPIYVDEVSDRIDMLLIVGGFATTEMFAAMEKKVKDVKNNAVKKGFVKEDEWQGIVKSLVKN